LKTQNTINIIVSAGGTGGHIFPAVAFAKEIREKYKNAEILFVGAKGRMEMEKVPKEGFEITGLWISGLQRKLTFGNLLFPFKVMHSVISSLSIINSFKPDLVVGFGGYASGAMLYAATLKKIPTIIHEQNSYAGITNKILKNKVDKICVSYDGMDKFFPIEKIVKTGNPVRPELLNINISQENALAHFGLDKTRKTLLVVGGSLGAKTINESIYAGIDKLISAGLNIIWQTGKNFDKSIDSYKSNLYVSPFIYEMDKAYAAADFVVSRAGALSIAELACVQKPVIFVPSPNVAEDHQTKNAMALVDKCAAILVKDSEARSILINTILNLASDNAMQEDLRKKISEFALPDASSRIVSVADEFINLKSQTNKKQ